MPAGQAASAAKPHKKWTPVSQPAAAKITEATSQPGVVYPLATSALPQHLQALPGVVSYFVSGYTSGVPISAAMTAGAEIAVVRTDGSMAKAYNFVLATSSNNQVYCNGPYKGFTNHHFDATTSVPIESLFGHGAFKKP